MIADVKNAARHHLAAMVRWFYPYAMRACLELHAAGKIQGLSLVVPPPDIAMLDPAFGLTFDDFYSCAGLRRVDAAFCARLAEVEPALASRLTTARSDPGSLSRLQESELLIALAPHLEDWLGQLFRIEREVAALQAAQNELAPL